jgi:hypothetical protein
LPLRRSAAFLATRTVRHRSGLCTRSSIYLPPCSSPLKGGALGAGGCPQTACQSTTTRALRPAFPLRVQLALPRPISAWSNSNGLHSPFESPLRAEPGEARAFAFRVLLIRPSPPSRAIRNVQGHLLPELGGAGGVHRRIHSVTATSIWAADRCFCNSIDLVSQAHRHAPLLGSLPLSQVHRQWSAPIHHAPITALLVPVSPVTYYLSPIPDPLSLVPNPLPPYYHFPRHLLARTTRYATMRARYAGDIGVAAIRSLDLAANVCPSDELVDALSFLR